jgi:hypothetical protein
MKHASEKRHHRPETTLEVTPDGKVRGLWNDALALPQLGRCTVQRVSYVEFSMHRQCWCVREARPASSVRPATGPHAARGTLPGAGAALGGTALRARWPGLETHEKQTASMTRVERDPITHTVRRSRF